MGDIRYEPLESVAARATASASDPNVIETVFGDRGVPSESMQKQRAFYTAIRAGVGEKEAYNVAIYERGEIGLKRPLKANAPDSDFITAARNADGEMVIVVNDAKIRSKKDSSFPKRSTTIPPKWEKNLKPIIDNLSIPGHPQLEREIKAAFDAKRYVRRDVHVDMANAESGHLPMTGWDDFKPAHFNLEPPGGPKRSAWSRAVEAGKPADANRGIKAGAKVLRKALIAVKIGRIDVKKIRLSTIKSLRIASLAAKNLGKGLLIGMILGIIEDVAWSAFVSLITSGVDERTLIRLEAKHRPEIQSKVERAILDHAWGLSRKPGLVYKVVLELRLVYILTPLNNFMLDEMRVDKAYVSDNWEGKDFVRQGTVKADLPDHFAAHQSEPDEFAKVLRISRVIDFEYPDVGKPSISGDWIEYYVGKGSDYGKEFPWARYAIGEPQDDAAATPIGASGLQIGQKEELVIRDAKWTGTHLLLSTEFKGTLSNYRLQFINWDTLSGSVTISTPWDVNRDGTRSWSARASLWRRRESLLEVAAKYLLGTR